MLNIKISGMTVANELHPSLSFIPFVQDGQNFIVNPSAFRTFGGSVRYFSNGFEVVASNTGVTVTKSTNQFTAVVPNTIELYKLSIAVEEVDWINDEIEVLANYQWDNGFNKTAATVAFPSGMRAWEIIENGPTNNLRWRLLNDSDLQVEIIGAANNVLTIKITRTFPTPDGMGISINF